MSGQSFKNRDSLIKEVNPSRIENLPSDLQILIDNFNSKYSDFFSNYESLSDEDFDKIYEQMERDYKEISHIALKMTLEKKSKKVETVPFVDINSIKNLSEFCKTFPMQFVPQKQEIGRILAIAKLMHNKRIKSGEAKQNSPIRILDIGGANGALGKLVTDLAKENNLEIEYLVIDPDLDSIDKAKTFYKDNPSLNFITQTGGEFNSETYSKNPEIISLIEERLRLIEKGETLRDRIEIMVEIIKEKIKNKASMEEIFPHIKVLRDIYFVDIDDSAMKNLQTLRDFFDYKYDETIDSHRDFSDYYLNEYRERINEISTEIQKLIENIPSNHDLTINSWMPVGFDMTNEVQESNGAAILYILERFGATGCRPDVEYPEIPETLGHKVSYNPGFMYKSQYGWIGHSTPQVRTMMGRVLNGEKDKKFWELGTSWFKSFSNAFIVQTKNNQNEQILNPHLKDLGIKVEGEYPWEQELILRGGAMTETIRLTDMEGFLSYTNTFNQLEEDTIASNT